MTSNLLDSDFNHEPSIDRTTSSEMGINEDEFNTWVKSQREYNDRYKMIPIHKGKVNVLEIEIVKTTEFKHRKSADRNILVEVECDKTIGRSRYKTTKRRPVDNIITWEETIRFVLPEHRHEGMLKVSLLTEDWKASRILLGQNECHYNEDMKGNFVDLRISAKSKVLLRISRNHNTQLRLSHGLCDEEMQYRIRRIPKVMKALEKVLDDESKPSTLSETPVLSIIGSGGGLRAACAMSGFVEGLDELGLVDSSTYMYGTSGSSWYVSGSYARRASHRGKERDDYHSWLRGSYTTSAFWELFNLKNYRNTYNLHKMKKKYHQPFTLVDFYGFAVSERLFGAKAGEQTLSDLRDYVNTAEVPYPILNCTQVDDFFDVRKYRADVNLSPHECEVPQYGVNVNSEFLNSRFYSGVLEKQLPPPKLSYITGTTGSVFGLRLNRILGLDAYEDENYFGVDGPSEAQESGSRCMLKWLSSRRNFLGRNSLIERTGQILNFALGLPDMRRFPIDPLCSGTVSETRPIDGFKEKEEVMSLVDGGILCNVAVDAALRPQRRNDVLFIGDFTDYDKEVNFETLESAVRLAKIGKCKFPPIDMDEIKSQPPKELYIFEDPDDSDCPIVFWFLLSTEKFKQNHDYVPRNPEVLGLLGRGERFTNFEVFGSKTYDTFNTTYSNLDFDRLRELAAYNVKTNAKVIKKKLAQKVSEKRTSSSNVDGFRLCCHASASCGKVDSIDDA